MKRPLALVLVAALVIVSPGLGAYEAAATVIRTSVGTPGTAASGAAGGVTAGQAARPAPAPSLNIGLSLGPSLIRPAMNVRPSAAGPSAAVRRELGPAVSETALSAAVGTRAGPSPSVLYAPRTGSRARGLDESSPGEIEAILSRTAAAKSEKGSHEDSGEAVTGGTSKAKESIASLKRTAGFLERLRSQRGSANLRLGVLKRLFDQQRKAQNLTLLRMAVPATGEDFEVRVSPARLSRTRLGRGRPGSGSYVLKAPAFPGGFHGTPPAVEGALRPESAEDLILKPDVNAPHAKQQTFKPHRLAKGAVLFIIALVLAQLGAESLGAALPTLVEKTFGNFAATVTHLTVLSYVAGFLALQAAPMIIKRFGIKRTFLAAHSAKLLTMGAFAALLGTGMMTLPLLQGLIILNAFIGGITSTAENSTPPALVGRDRAALEHYWTREQAFRQLISISGPIATGAMVASLGFFPAFLVFPITTAMTLWIVWKMVQIPEEARRVAARAGGRKAPGPAPDREMRKGARAEAQGRGVKKSGEEEEKGLKASFVSWISQFGRGARMVWRDPGLRYSALAFSALAMTAALLYALIAPAYGLLLAGPGMEEMATGISGWIIGLYNAGGMLGVLSLMRLQKRQAKELSEGALTRPKLEKHLRKSLLRTMLWATAGLALLAAFALPLPTLAAFLPSWAAWAGGISVPALAIMPLGFAQVVALLKLRSFFQSRVKDQRDMPDAMGFLGAATLLSQAAGLMVLKYFFTGMAGFTPFVYLVAGLVPLAAIYLILRDRIKKHSK